MLDILGLYLNWSDPGAISLLLLPERALRPRPHVQHSSDCQLFHSPSSPTGRDRAVRTHRLALHVLQLENQKSLQLETREGSDLDLGLAA